MRLPLVTPLVSRDGTSNKDGRMTNVLAEDGGRIAAVRPALQIATSATSGNGQGLVDFNGTLLSVYGASLKSTIPYGPVGGDFVRGSTSPTFQFTTFQPTSVEVIAVDWANGDCYVTADGFTYFSTGGFPGTVDGLPIAMFEKSGIVYAVNDRLYSTPDDGITWDLVSATPVTPGFIVNVEGNFYYYNGARTQLRVSTNNGATFGTAQTVTGLDLGTSEIPIFCYVGDGYLYVFDGNGFCYRSTDFLNFQTIGLATNGRIPGPFDDYDYLTCFYNGQFYGFSDLSGKVISRDITLSTRTVIGDAPNSYLNVASPYIFGNSLFFAGIGVAYSTGSTITTETALTGTGQFDFVQSTT